MITRVVKMTFRDGTAPAFLELFGEVRAHIISFKGCLKLELFRDAGNENIFVTISEWKDENALEAYRASALFDETWLKAKALFAAKPAAWSLEKES